MAVLQIALVAPALAEINLVASGWVNHELDVVYCNADRSPAIVKALTPGRFVGSDRFAVPPQKCGEARFISSETQHVFHVLSGDTIKVLTYNHRKQSFLTTDSARNLLFILVGAFLGSFQRGLRAAFVVPMFVMKLWVMYLATRRALQASVDDPLKGVALAPELSDFGKRITVESSFVPVPLADRIRRLDDTFNAWKQEKVVSADTRRRIREL